VSTTVLSETCATWRGLLLVLVIRGGLWLGECLGGTACRANVQTETSLEPSARTQKEHRGGCPHSGPIFSERYVVCIVSFVGFQSSPFFQSRNVIAAILRARVTLANSGFVPRSTQAW
jgi:hypothetical protein